MARDEARDVWWPVVGVCGNVHRRFALGEPSFSEHRQEPGSTSRSFRALPCTKSRHLPPAVEGGGVHSMSAASIIVAARRRRGPASTRCRTVLDASDRFPPPRAGTRLERRSTHVTPTCLGTTTRSLAVHSRAADCSAPETVSCSHTTKRRGRRRPLSFTAVSVLLRASGARHDADRAARASNGGLVVSAERRRACSPRRC